MSTHASERPAMPATTGDYLCNAQSPTELDERLRILNHLDYHQRREAEEAMAERLDEAAALAGYVCVVRNPVANAEWKCRACRQYANHLWVHAEATEPEAARLCTWCLKARLESARHG